MQTSTLILLGFVSTLLILSSCEGKRLFLDDDNDVEINEAKARAFLQDDSEDDVDKRATSNDCVLCKFNTIRCCKPNICVKKRFRPDECMEIKGK